MANGTYSYTGGAVTYTVKTTGVYDITAYGAQGGSGDAFGGKGAEIGGDFTLQAGTVLRIVVGGQGTYGIGSNFSSGGGGGSFVIETSNGASQSHTPLVIAGGGGGTYESSGGGPGHKQAPRGSPAMDPVGPAENTGREGRRAFTVAAAAAGTAVPVETR